MSAGTGVGGSSSLSVPNRSRAKMASSQPHRPPQAPAPPTSAQMASVPPLMLRLR